MEPITIFVVVAVIVALVFDFTNGMHDSANSISTIVATRVLSPRLAVVWAAFFNFVAFAIFGTAVAKTIGSGMIDLKSVTVTVIFAVCWAPSAGICLPGTKACPPALRTR